MENRSVDEEKPDPTKEGAVNRNTYDVTSNDVTHESSHDVMHNGGAKTDKNRLDERRAELLPLNKLSRDVHTGREPSDHVLFTATADHEIDLHKGEHDDDDDAASTLSTYWCCFCRPEPPSTSATSTCCCSPCCSRCHCCCCGVFSGESTEPENKRFVFRWYDVPLCVGGGALYVFDVYTDLRLAVQYLGENHVIFGSVTLAFVLLAYFVSVGYGLKEYFRLRRDDDPAYKASSWVWFVRILGTVLMLGPVVNYVEYMYNGSKSRCVRCPDRDKYVRRMKNHHLNNAFLRLFEACLEAAPQLVFQLYVLITTELQLQGVEGVWRVLTMVSSWFSLAHTLTAFTKSRRNNDDTLRPATVKHQIFHLLWRLAETGGRVLSLALFASLFQFWLLAVLVPHGLVMAVWQYLQERDAGFISVLEYFVYAYVFLFCFINNYSGGHSRIQYLAFYVLFYAENLAMLGLWYWFSLERDGAEGMERRWWSPYTTWILIVALASLPVHVFLQLIYYKCCHPSSEHIKTCVPRNRKIWKLHLIGPFTPVVSSGNNQQLGGKLS